MSLDVWPELKYAEWGDCCSTLQMWLQIVGKIRMALTPAVNHTWNVTLYPTARGLTTMPMWHGTRTLQIDFDFIDHELVVQTSSGGRGTIALAPMTVAEFYKRLMLVLDAMGTPVKIWPHPVEVAEAIPFEEDQTHRAYDPEHVRHFWQVLLQTTRVFAGFRARFTGKVSPIHLFWGAMDLACTRFSGRTAPEHPSMPGLPDRVVRDAYSHEVSSAGFWPGGPGVDAFFYSYAYPEPRGYREWAVRPKEARFDATFGEFVLPYAAMRAAKDPDAMLLEFLESTYEAAAELGKWDRKALEIRS
jgi:hypothetical protein